MMIILGGENGAIMKTSIKYTKVSFNCVRGELIPNITIQDQALYESLWFEDKPVRAVIKKDYIHIQRVKDLMEKEAITYSTSV